MRGTAPPEDDQGMSTTSPLRPESAHPTRPAPPAHLEWSLQVPAYEPGLVGLWTLGALAHGYAVRAVAPVTVGIVAGFTWVVWDAVWPEPSVLGVLLSVAALGVVAVSLAASMTP